jgi:hypothetical protein
MLTFSASPRPDGNWLPPVDHLDSLLSSWDAVTTALDRALDHRRYERLAILEPHESGYLHIHLAVFVDGVVTTDDLAPVIETHLRHCDLAKPPAHDLEDDSTISVRHAGADRSGDAADHADEHLDELAIYLAEYLGCYGEAPTEQPENVQAANALLWATGRQRWRPSNGAQSYMATEPRDGGSDWSIVGVAKSDDPDDIIPTDGSHGGVDTFTTGGLDPPS